MLAACAIVLVAATSTHAALIVPLDLSPGDTYHLAFVTRISTDATSSDIADYNDLVQAVADAAGLGSVTWYAIGSTLAVDASSNALVSAPVYNMNRARVADDFADFWDGTHASAISYNEIHALRTGNNNVWTGTQADGTSGGAGQALGEATPLWGEMLALSSAWVERDTNVNTVDTYGLYALSEPLVVPEPSSPWLLATAVAGLAGCRWLRRARAR